jgi:hypothetical protein
MKNLFKTTVVLAAALFLTVTPVNAKEASFTTPTASTSNLITVSNLGHTSDGSMGRLTIGSYTAKLYKSSSQDVVDAVDSAAYIPWGSIVMIADHASDGFDVIRDLNAGATGTITDDQETTVLTMVDSYQGSNTGHGIILADGRRAETLTDGDYMLYTCNDSEGVSVTVTYWQSGAAQAVQASAPLESITEPVVSANGEAMYRLYNPNSGEHFYTASKDERDSLRAQGWSYEGLGWTAPTSSNTPVYRMYNGNSGVHHYTTSAAERDYLTGLGWNYEGIGWYSDDNQSVALYRQYNPNSGQHNYTSSTDENNSLVAAGWSSEGVCWYGIN